MSPQDVTRRSRAVEFKRKAEAGTRPADCILRLSWLESAATGKGSQACRLI